MRSAINKITKFLGSNRFLKLVFGLFIIGSVWIAFSAAYPQAFDENFHFGLIQVYSHYWLPFFSKQPPNANAFGAVARDPSYLYHYLLSFPYRIIDLFVHGQTGQVIILRLINIGLFTSGLILFRGLLLRVGISKALSNTTLFLFMLIPIVPQLAAQINYDNLLFPLVAWACLMTFDVIDQIKKRQPSTRAIISLSILCILTSLVKYEFMPIALGIFVFLAWITYQNFHGQFRKFLNLLHKSWLTQSSIAKVVLVGLLVISIGMFTQRDVVNLVEYHSITPNCSKVLSVSDCSAYSAWEYNYTNHNNVVNSVTTIKYYNPVIYLGEWVYWMWYRLFFAVSGPAQFTNYPPLPLPSAAAAVIGIAGIVGVIKWRRRIFQGDPYILFLLLVCVIYIITLIAEGYSTYRYTDVLENMNGRYLLPILILFAAIAGRAFSIALGKAKTRKVVFALLALVLFLQGGGVLTFITRSDPTWDFQNKTVIQVNDAARRITKPVLIKGNKTYDSSLWFFN